MTYATLTEFGGAYHGRRDILDMDLVGGGEATEDAVARRNAAAFKQLMGGPGV